MTKIPQLADSLLLLWSQKKEEIHFFKDKTFVEMNEILKQSAVTNEEISFRTIDLQYPLASSFFHQCEKIQQESYLMEVSSLIVDVLMKQLLAFHRELDVLMHLISILHGSQTIEPSTKWEQQKILLNSTSIKFKEYRTQCHGFIYRHFRSIYQNQNVLTFQDGDPLFHMVQEEFLSLLRPVENYIIYIDELS